MSSWTCTGRESVYPMSYENSWRARSFNSIHARQASCILLGQHCQSHRDCSKWKRWWILMCNEMWKVNKSAWRERLTCNTRDDFDSADPRSMQEVVNYIKMSTYLGVLIYITTGNRSPILLIWIWWLTCYFSSSCAWLLCTNNLTSINDNRYPNSYYYKLLNYWPQSRQPCKLFC